ncbi:IS110 family transposase [Botrimarina sp.]|uniref:IS110 family transposase n=1 Tax=Botrimarina sp. TaxID=2795802 RepID=UPI0032EF29E6
MKYVGVDLHKKSISVCVVSQSREVQQSRRFWCVEEHRIEAFFRELGPCRVVVEATIGYEWFLRLVEPHTERAVLAHPGKLRVIAQSTRKSDKLDARVLAEFLALGMIPEAHRPTPRVRDHRALVRHRQHVQQRITATKSKIRRVLWDYNADRSDLFTRLGHEFLDRLELSPADRFRVEQLRKHLAFLQERLKEANEQLRSFAKEGVDQEVRYRELLRTIPGVGEVTSEVVLAELGDPSRFRSSKQAVAYAGLAPGWRESAGKRKELSIEKKGSKLLRWVLVESAWQVVRYDARWRNQFEQLAKRTGKKKAIVATARRLLTVMVAILRSGEPYQPGALA